MLAGFVGYLVITRVPPLLHTPLMSATNAISGISLVGSLVAAGSRPQPRRHHPRLHRRHLRHDQRRRRLPHHRPHAEDVQGATDAARRTRRRREPIGRELFTQRRRYLAASVLFILGLRSLTSPDTRAARHAAGRARHAARHRRHAAQPRDRRLRLDRRRARASARVDRLPARHVGADDGDAAADRASRTCSARSPRRWSASPSTTPTATAPSVAPPRRMARARLRGPVRRAHRHRQLHGLRQAAGAPARRARHLSRARTPSTSRSSSLALAACSSTSIVTPARAGGFYAMIALALVVRRAAGAADRRRRHAGGDLAAQLLRRPRGLGRPASRSTTTSSSSRARSTARRASSSRS